MFLLFFSALFNQGLFSLHDFDNIFFWSFKLYSSINTYEFNYLVSATKAIARFITLDKTVAMLSNAGAY